MNKIKTKKIKLPNGETVEASWGADFSDVQITQNQRVLCQLANPQEALSGRSFRTEGGQILAANVDKFGLAVWHNGLNLMTNTASGTTDYYRVGTTSLFGFGSVYSVVSIMSTLATENYWILIGLVIGLAFFALGYYCQKTKQPKPMLFGGILAVIATIPAISSILWLILAILGCVSIFKGYKTGPLGGYELPEEFQENDPLDKLEF